MAHILSLIELLLLVSRVKQEPKKPIVLADYPRVAMTKLTYIPEFIYLQIYLPVI